jgi:hypothetical protein
VHFVGNAKQLSSVKYAMTQQQYTQENGQKLRALQVKSKARSKASRKQKAHEREFVGYLGIRGRPCGIRTCDQRIKSPLLYQLS